MNDLAIAYFEWHPVITYNRQTNMFEHATIGIDMIRTKGGEIYSPDEWLDMVKKIISDRHLEDLYEQVLEYVSANHLWLKGAKETEIHACDCLLHESYKRWNDFSIQEKLRL